MIDVAIVGVGSPFGADNIASAVMTCLRQDPFFKDMHLHYYDRPGLALLEYIKPFNTVHLIDAVISGNPPGTLHHYEDITVFQQHKKLLSSHDFGLAETLLLGQALQQLPAKLTLHGIEISLDTMDNHIVAEACIAINAHLKWVSSHY